MPKLCEGYEARYLHMLQPTLHDPGSKVISDKERTKGMPDGEFDERVVRGYGLLRQGIKELRERGVESHDTSFLFEGIDAPIYTDSCHFGKRGNHLVADKLIELIRNCGSGRTSEAIVDSRLRESR